MWYTIIRVLLIAIAIYFIIATVKIVRIILTVVLGAVYIPLNTLYLAVQKWYFHMKHKDKIVFYLFTPFYWILVGITFVISGPYEFVISMNIH